MATIHDVAIATGVSDATVSRALRGMNSVRPSTRQLVLDAARRLDFTLSRSASSLASGKTMRVVMLFGCTIASWFNASCIEGALETLEPHGYDLVPVRVCDLEQLHGFFADLPSNGRNMDGSSSRHSRWTTANRRCFPACISPRSPSTHGALPACPHP